VGQSANVAADIPLLAHYLDLPPGPDHDQRHPAQYRHQRGAQRGQGSLRDERSSQPLARYVEATMVMPCGKTRTVPHYAPFPLAMTLAQSCRM
jgi:hypothetical protein